MKDIKKFSANHSFLIYKVFLLILWIVAIIGISTITGQAAFDDTEGPL